jgi:hypothetical protein
VPEHFWLRRERGPASADEWRSNENGLQSLTMSSAPRRLVVTVVVAGVLFGAAAAGAAPPTLSTVGAQDRHPTATFAAPKADSVTIYVATKPDRASDGEFLSENVVEVATLTDAEIQAGVWTDVEQLDPGNYYVLLDADPSFDACYIADSDTFDPTCADGWSEVLPLTVPRPAIRYSGAAVVRRSVGQVTLTLTATPLGVQQAYKVCYWLKTKARRCLGGVADGFDWSAPGSGRLTVKTRGLAATTTFTWFVDGAKVAGRTVRVR